MFDFYFHADMTYRFINLTAIFLLWARMMQVGMSEMGTNKFGFMKNVQTGMSELLNRCGKNEISYQLRRQISLPLT